MALPKHIRPEYSTTIPSTGKKIRYQPFSVKEEKILVLAAESTETDEISNAIRNVLTNCVTHPADFKVEELALFDIEFLFLKARSKSAGETISVKVTDPNDETYSVDHEINIDRIGVKKFDGHTNLIDLSETTKVQMRYPDIQFFNDGINMDDISAATSIIARCVNQIVIDDEEFTRADMKDKEIEEWLDGLTSGDLKKVTSFFDSMPKLTHSFTLKNPNTGEEFTTKLEGLADFF